MSKTDEQNEAGLKTGAPAAQAAEAQGSTPKKRHDSTPVEVVFLQNFNHSGSDPQTGEIIDRTYRRLSFGVDENGKRVVIPADRAWLPKCWVVELAAAGIVCPASEYAQQGEEVAG